MSMQWIGITGGIACGKSTVSKQLKALGHPVIDADQVVHFLMQKNKPLYREIVDSFGIGILNQDHDIDRKKLGELVFGSSESLKQLEALVHPRVKEEVFRLRGEYSQKGAKVIFYDVPLLFEKKMVLEFDKIIVVFCDEQLQLKRLMERSSLTRQEAKMRILAQLPLSHKISNADFVIENNGSFEELNTKIKFMCDWLFG